LSANVFTFPGRAKGPQPWTNDELAELYRVVDLLGRAGLSVATDMGMSDEGDPWFVFCRVDNEEVIAHFARIDGVFVAASIAVDETFRGANFRAIVDRMVSSQPLVVPAASPGSRLLLHPAVLLTAFVATALAHSEKMIAQDWLRSVEAQWEHGKESALHALKQVKTGWADTLHTLMKLPVTDARLAYDSAKEGLTLTLASLIAIAMTALQPIAQQIADIAQMIEDFPAHIADAAHQTADHIATSLLLDAPALAGADRADTASHGHGADASQGNPESAMAHKAAPAAALDAASSDGARATVDAAHMVAPLVQKAMVDDPLPHLTIDTQFDANFAALAAQRVVATATATAQAEPIVVHFDTGAVSVPSLDLQDVTSDAIRLLDIKINDKSGNPAAPSSGTDANSGTSSHPASPPADNAGATSSQLLVSSSQPAVSAGSTVAPAGPVSDGNGNLVLNVDTTNGAIVKSAISDFVTSGTHGISQQVAIADPIAQQELAGILSVYGTVKVVFFESSNPTSDVFLYSPGLVFVEEKDLASSVHLSNPGGDLILQGGTAGTITLVGVAVVGHLGTA